MTDEPAQPGELEPRMGMGCASIVFEDRISLDRLLKQRFASIRPAKWGVKREKR